LTLLAVLTLIVTFFANPIGKYYAQSYAQKLLKTPVEISQLNLRLLDKSLNVDLLIFCSRVNCSPSNSMASMTIKLLPIVPTFNKK
jgi:hypothetical protein